MKLPNDADVLPHRSMKLIGALGGMLVGTMLIGCGSSGSGAPQAKAPSGPAIGTTTLSSAAPAPDPNPRYLSIDAEEPAPARTWGAAPARAQDPSEASDLAQNPYTRKRDIYDPN